MLYSHPVPHFPERAGGRYGVALPDLRESMRAVKALKPGRKGTKELLTRFRPRSLVCPVSLRRRPSRSPQDRGVGPGVRELRTPVPRM